MAEIVLSFVVEETLGRVVSLITHEITIAWNLQKDIKGLQDSVTMIKAVLQDAEEQQTKREPVRLWLKKLKEVAYDAEDLFNELTYENLHRKVESDKQDQLAREVSSHNPFFKLTRYSKKTAFHIKIAHKVKKINELLAKIKKEAKGHTMMTQIDLDRGTDSVLVNPVIGREYDVSKIVNLLSCSCDQQVLTIVSIVGMGGLGKTALVKLVSKDVMSKKFFDVSILVCVSHNFDEQKILGEMLQTLNGNRGALTNREAILQQLQKELERKKFLLVLDDVWEEVSKRWDGLRSRLLVLEINSGRPRRVDPNRLNIH